MVPCVCCGHRTVTADGDSFCAVCGWDDRDPYAGWTHRRDLREAQRRFRATGNCDADLAELTRPPTAVETPPPWWHSLDDEPAVVLALVDDAFADVRLDGGTTLDEAELIDDHALPSRRESDRPPPGHVDPGRWQDLAREALEGHPWGNFAFHDARGLRFYLPAHMRAALTGPFLADFESLLYSLAKGHRLPALEQLLTSAQAHAVARFLAHVATAGRTFEAGARAALRHLWGRHLDPEHANLLARCPP